MAVQQLQKPKRTPIRSCVVCRQTSDKRGLLRVVRLPAKEGGAIVADPTGKRSGRGAYICPNASCIGSARKQRRFENALSAPSASIVAELFIELEAIAASEESASAGSPADSSKRELEKPMATL